MILDCGCEIEIDKDLCDWCKKEPTKVSVKIQDKWMHACSEECALSSLLTKDDIE